MSEYQEITVPASVVAPYPYTAIKGGFYGVTYMDLEVDAIMKTTLAGTKRRGHMAQGGRVVLAAIDDETILKLGEINPIGIVSS